jgi:hypothetical protein
MYRFCALMVFLSLAACGGGGGGTNGPPPLENVLVTVNDPLRMGQTTQATGTATYSDGRTQAIASGFRSDANGVATVTDGGMVAGVGNGQQRSTWFMRASRVRT